jgi:hypothetical protein
MTQPRRPIELPHPDDLRERILQGGRQMRAGQGPEQRHGGRCRPVTARFDRDEVGSERIARLCAVDVEGPRLWVEEGEFTHHRHEVGARTDAARKAVLRPQFENTPGLHTHHRRGAAERPGELAGFGAVGDHRWESHRCAGVVSLGSSSRCTRDISATRSGCLEARYTSRITPISNHTPTTMPEYEEGDDSGAMKLNT